MNNTTEIREISRSELKKFVKFPFRLYRDCQQWVPPIIKDEISILDSSTNQMLKNSDSYYFLAYQKNKIVGRVAVIINHEEMEQEGKIRFGWLDFIDDLSVSKILIDKVLEISKKYKTDHIEGPVGVSNIDKAGTLTEGFQLPGKLTTIYNYSYYPKHLEQLGLEKLNKWVEYGLAKPEDLSRIHKIANMVEKRYNVKPKSFKSKKELFSYADEMFNLMNIAFKDLSTFKPMEDHQIAYYVKKYSNFIHTDYVSFVFNDADEMVGFGVTIPDLSYALQKANGKLYPFGIYHLYKGFKKVNMSDLLFIGVHPDYRAKGITSVIFSEMAKTYEKNNIERVEIGPGLENNDNFQRLWGGYEGIETLRKRATYTMK